MKKEGPRGLMTILLQKLVRFSSVCLEVGNFPHYGDFEGLIGKKNNGEFPTQKLGNLALSRLCDTFYSKYYIFAIKHLNMSYFQTYDTLYEIVCVPR